MRRVFDAVREMRGCGEAEACLGRYLEGEGFGEVLSRERGLRLRW